MNSGTGRWGAAPAETTTEREVVKERVVVKYKDGGGDAQAIDAYVKSHGSEARTALVIGNSNYSRWGRLKNAVNDAQLISGALRGAGFKVETVLDANREQMLRAVGNLAQRVRGGTVLVYYSGHGIQAGDFNYLIPVDADIHHQDDIAIEAVNFGDVMAALRRSPARVQLVVLDACRDNPVPSATRGGSRGLMFHQSSGALIAYSTQAGSTAADGDGTNSPYSAALAEAITTPGLSVEDAFKQVRRRVKSATGERQVPVEASLLHGDFYFKW